MDHRLGGFLGDHLGHQAAVALMGGEVDEVVVSVASSLPYIRTGKVRPLAVFLEATEWTR